MSGLTFIANPSFLEQLGGDSATIAVYDFFADEVLQQIKAFTPVKTGRQQRAWRIEHDEIGMPYVSTTSPLWHFIEFGTVHEAPQAPIRRGIEAAGCKWSNARGRLP